ncbi:unnamed protein product [Rotaria sp. Silwood2]|nr:unnamed protein product [Rotaria sp. Silwood2]
MQKARYEPLLTEFPKIVGIYITIDDLCASIQQEIYLINKQLQAFTFYNQHQKSLRDLSKESAEFLWFQLFNDVISHLPRNQQAKKQMIDACRLYYRGNSKELKFIDEFDRTYRCDDAIRWYSKQCFVYKIVNKALRCEDINQLHLFRFFIGDLSESLAREHKKILFSNQKLLNVYRGVKLSNDEFNKLKEANGKLISTNSYFSTSQCRLQALAFAKKPTKRDDLSYVLFEIECNIEELGENVIFADIANFSEYPQEKEVLFDLGTSFRIENIINEKQLWVVKLKATNEGRNIVQYYVEETRRETEEKSVVIMFGRLLCDMGQYQKAELYFEQILIDPNGEDIAWIEHNLGRVFQSKGDWKKAREYYDRAYHRMIKVNPPRTKDSAYVLNNIGSILHDQGKYNEALKFYKQTLTIQEKYYSSNHIDIARSLNNIGNILTDQENFDQALDFHRRALEIRKNYYGDDHIDIAQSLNNIGTILRSQGEYSQALEYHLQALAIREKFYPPDHIDIAQSLNNIGNIFSDLENYEEALNFHQRALKIREKFYSNSHVDVAQSLANISIILKKQNKYNEALDFQRRALAMKEQHCTNENLDVVDISNNIHDSQRTYDSRKHAACTIL